MPPRRTHGDPPFCGAKPVVRASGQSAPLHQAGQGSSRCSRSPLWRTGQSCLIVVLHMVHPARQVSTRHFHAVRLANTVVDQGRRRTQQATLGHRGGKRDPRYRIRKLLLTAAEQLTQRGRVRLRAGLAAGDPTGEVAAAWQGKELLRAVSAAVGTAAARAALDRFYRWCDGVQVAELSRLARTVRAWEVEILASTPPTVAPTASPRPSTCSSRKSSVSATAFATSPTTAYGCCSTGGWHGKLIGPHNCEAVPHAWCVEPHHSGAGQGRDVTGVGRSAINREAATACGGPR